MSLSKSVHSLPIERGLSLVSASCPLAARTPRASLSKRPSWVALSGRSVWCDSMGDRTMAFKPKSRHRCAHGDKAGHYAQRATKAQRSGSYTPNTHDNLAGIGSGPTFGFDPAGASDTHDRLYFSSPNKWHPHKPSKAVMRIHRASKHRRYCGPSR